MKIGILNTTIITGEGTFKNRKISVEEARKIVEGRELDSAVGHQGSAEALTVLLGRKIEMKRQDFKQEVGQDCICLKMKGRLQEGVILTLEEMDKIGYDLYLLTKISEETI